MEAVCGLDSETIEEGCMEADRNLKELTGVRPPRAAEGDREGSGRDHAGELALRAGDRDVVNRS